MERITDKVENPPLEYPRRIIEWLNSANYRVIMHRHNNTFRAIDEVDGFSWTADTLWELQIAIFTQPPFLYRKQPPATATLAPLKEQL